MTSQNRLDILNRLKASYPVITEFRNASFLLDTIMNPLTDDIEFGKAIELMEVVAKRVSDPMRQFAKLDDVELVAIARSLSDSVLNVNTSKLLRDDMEKSLEKIKNELAIRVNNFGKRQEKFKRGD